MAQEQQDVETLKRRGRRRLVGAVALVLLAVVVLPMVFDHEPRGTLPPVSVRIPGENDTPFKPKLPARPAKKAPEPAAAAGDFVIAVGAYAHPDAVIAKLVDAKLPYYTERLKGNLTRVRAGPFATREAADQAHDKLKALGLKPGGVTVKPG
ncbi:MAG TPA: SPOR domain-containing protein [Burkholderiales bacterium]